MQFLVYNQKNEFKIIIPLFSNSWLSLDKKEKKKKNWEDVEINFPSYSIKNKTKSKQKIQEFILYHVITSYTYFSTTFFFSSSTKKKKKKSWLCMEETNSIISFEWDYFSQ